MRRLLLLGCSVLALATGASAGGPEPLFATEWRLGGGITIVRLDRTTLKPLAGQRINAGHESHVLARSPGGRYLAVSGGNSIRVLDLRTHKRTPVFHPAGWMSAGLWTQPNLLVAVGHDELLLLDPRGPRLTGKRRVDLGGDVLAARRSGSRLVLLLGPSDAIGPLSVAVADGSGNVRTVKVDGMRGGRHTLKDDERNPIGMRTETPGFAVDPSGTRAVIVGLNAVAEVSLDRPSATTRSFSGRTLQKSLEGWERGAVWLDASHVATYGADYHGEQQSTPVPLQMLDLRDLGTTPLDTKASYATKLGSLLVAIGDEIAVFEPDGRLRYRALGERRRGPVVALGNRLYAETSGSGTSWVVLDAADGMVLARRTFARPTQIVSGF